MIDLPDPLQREKELATGVNAFAAEYAAKREAEAREHRQRLGGTQAACSQDGEF